VTTADQIRLELPAHPEYGRVAGIAALHLARRRGFSPRELEELVTAIDEVVRLLGIGGSEDTLRVDYGGDGTTIVVDARLWPGGELVVPLDRIDHFGEAAGDLVDDYSVGTDEPRVVFTKGHHS